jgi:transcriptional regulator with XRE-family HTH domain
MKQAVIELRRATGLSQQHFGSRMGLSTKSIQFYETGRIPGVKTLLWFAAAAEGLDRDDLYEVFMGDALMAQIDPPPGYQIEIHFRRSLPKGAKKQ